MTMFPYLPPMYQENFLGYVPHNGFHNQRMTLETAIRLAAHLNRALLLPPLYLSRKATNMAWRPFPEILEPWSLRTKIDIMEACRDYDPTSTIPPKTRQELNNMSPEDRKRENDCTFYHDWTVTPWTYIYDVPKVLNEVVRVGLRTEPIQVFDRPNMTLQIQDLSKEMYSVPDTTRYDIQILDYSEYDYRSNSTPSRDKTTWEADGIEQYYFPNWPQDRKGSFILDPCLDPIDWRQDRRVIWNFERLSEERWIFGTKIF